MLTEQQVFDKVAAHLLTQRRKSIDSESWCKYRDGKGGMCAAGCLIDDAEYTTDMEFHSWNYLYLAQNPGVCKIGHVDLVTDLQRVHDHFDPKRWKQELTAVALIHNLDRSILNQYEDIQ